MKKIMAWLVLAVMLSALCGCAQNEETAAHSSVEATVEVTGDIDTVRKAYQALSEEDKSRFYEEIAAEHEDSVAADLSEIAQSVYGQWRTELILGYSEELLLKEDMTYQFGQQEGTWYVDESGEQILLVNGVDHVIYFIFSIVEEDGITKLLCQETQDCYIRTEDFHDVFEKKYVTTLGAEASEFFGQAQFVGTVAKNIGHGPNWDVCVLDSLAYEQGLVYIGRSSGFEMEVTQELKDGSTHTSVLNSPFEFMSYYDGSKIASIEITSGMAYFVRSEYVKDIFIDEYDHRTVLLKNGTEYLCDGFVWIWEYFPEIPLEDFLF